MRARRIGGDDRPQRRPVRLGADVPGSGVDVELRVGGVQRDTQTLDVGREPGQVARLDPDRRVHKGRFPHAPYRRDVLDERPHPLRGAGRDEPTHERERRL